MTHHAISTVARRLPLLAVAALVVSASGCGDLDVLGWGWSSHDAGTHAAAPDAGLPSTLHVEGRVLDADQRPMQGVKVWVADHDPVTTDFDGLFAFDDVDPPYALAAQWQDLVKVADGLTSQNPEVAFDVTNPYPRSCQLQGSLRNATPIDRPGIEVSFTSTCPTNRLTDSSATADSYQATFEWACPQPQLTGTLDLLEYDADFTGGRVIYIGYAEKHGAVLDPGASPSQVDLDMQPVSTAELLVSVTPPDGMSIESPRRGIERDGRRLDTLFAQFVDSNQIKLLFPAVPGWAPVIDLTARRPDGHPEFAVVYWKGTTDAFTGTASLAFLEPPRPNVPESGVAELPADNAHLSWEPGAAPDAPNDARYDYVVRLYQFRTRYEIATTSTSISLSRLAGLPLELRRENTTWWSVETLERSGERVARTATSGSNPFQLK